LIGYPVRGRIRVLVDGDHLGAEVPQGDRQLPAELIGAEQYHSGPHGLGLSFGHAIGHG
jgi:hypothetical protein